MKLMHSRRAARNYPLKAERDAFDDGYSDGYHDREPDRINTMEYPNAYSAGYWEGVHDKREEQAP